MDTITLSIEDPAYPERLRQIHTPPKTLHIKGNLQALHEPQIAIVGCRQMTSYGAEQAYQFAKALTEIGIVVTSGLAIGIDTMAHRGALAHKGQTIAVLGTGLNKIYPSQNKKLAAEIMSEGGAVISEFPADMEAFPYNFPKRNRIISALSLGVLVIEAAEKSGSLITARLALEQNREVFVLPGPINSPQSRGCNRLIKTGATLIQSIPDLLVEIQDKLKSYTADYSQTIQNDRNKKIHLQSPKKHDNPIKKSEHMLLAFLSDMPTPVDVLSVKTDMSLQALNAELLNLELAGTVQLVAGGYILK